MGALISSNTLILEPDGLSYQTAKIKLSAQPPNANTLVFYYKAYFDTIIINPFGAEFTESGSTYSWNNDAMFGLSFSGTVSGNVGGFVGFSNGTSTNILRARPPALYDPFAKNSGYSGAIPVGFNSMGEFYYGNGQTSSSNDFIGVGSPGIIAPSTYFIGLTGAKKYLGMFKISKNENTPQNIVLSCGNNWENFSSSSFSTALTSLCSNWFFQNVDRAETVNFRPNYTNPLSANTINFPSWIVVKYPSSVLGRNFVITDIKIEYYS